MAAPSTRLLALYVPAGTTSTQTNTGTLTSAGIVSFQVQKKLAGTLTSSGALTRKPTVIYLGTLTSAGALKRQANKPLSGTLTTAGALTPAKIIALAVSGTLTTAGALKRQANKALSGTLTTAGSLTRSAQKALSGALTTAGALIRQAQIRLHGGDIGYAVRILDEAGVRGYWRLGEAAGTTAADELGITNGTYVGSPTLSATGIPGGGGNTAVSFDGATQYVNLGTSTVLRPSAAVAVEVWLKTSDAADQMIYASTISPFYGFNVFLTGGQIRFETDTSVTGLISLLSDATGLADGQWHQAVCTYDGTTKKIAIDGTVGATTQSASGTLQYGTGNNVIGAYPDLASYFFHGDLDEVVVSDTALSAAVILQHYRSGIGLKLLAGALVAAQVTPTVTPISVGGTLATAGNVVKQVNKALGGTLTTAGSIKWLVSTRYTGALTTGGNLIRQAQKKLAGTLTTAGALANLKLVFRTFTGTLTTTGALTRRVNKLLGGTLASAGNLVRQPNTVMRGTLTLTGALIRQAIKKLAGALGLAGSLSTTQFSASPGVGVGDLIRIETTGTLEFAGATGTLVPVLVQGSLVREPIVSGTLIRESITGTLELSDTRSSTLPRELVGGTLTRSGR